MKLTTTEKAIRSIERSIANMNKQLKIVKLEHHDAMFYMSCDSMNVLAGESHDEEGHGVQGDNILSSTLLRGADCGDW